MYASIGGHSTYLYSSPQTKEDQKKKKKVVGQAQFTRVEKSYKKQSYSVSGHIHLYYMSWQSGNQGFEYSGRGYIS